jgi:ABC-type branched-chain amino acid transport systems, ATPase component
MGDGVSQVFATSIIKVNSNSPENWDNRFSLNNAKFLTYHIRRQEIPDTESTVVAAGNPQDITKLAPFSRYVPAGAQIFPNFCVK